MIMITRRPDEPVALIPELKLATITYDMHIRYGSAHPEPDEYLVSVGNRTKRINSIYQVVSVREVQRKSRQSANYRRWALQVIRVPELKDQVTHDATFNHIKVGEQEAWPIYWYSRDKKKR